MTITVKRQIAPQVAGQPTQQSAVSTAAPVIEALDIVGRTVSELGRVGGQIQAIDKREEARLLRLREEAEERNDKSVATEAVTLTKGAASAQINQYKNTRLNANAKGLVADYDAFSKELTSKGMENLNDRQKQIYVEALLPVNTANRVNLLDFENDQTINGQRISAKSSMDIGTKNAIVNFENPLTYIVERSNIEDQIDSLADIEKWDADTKQLEFIKRIAVLEEGRIRQWSLTDAKVAKELFELNKNVFDLKKQEELEGIINKDDTAQDARSAVISLREQFPGDLNKQIDTAENDQSLSPEASKQTISQLRQRSKDDKARKDAENLALNDQVTGGVDDILNDTSRDNGDAYIYVRESNLTNTEKRKQESYIDTEIKRLEVDVVTDPDKLTEYYNNPQQFKSIGDVRRATSALSKKDASDFETWWQNGGTVGGLNESQIRSAFKLYAGFDANSIPVTYQNARRAIVSMTDSLPPGQKVTATNLDTWMKQAVRGEADTGNLPTKESIEVTTRMTEDQRDNVISQMEAGNDARVKAGKKAFPINAETITKASLNVYPRLRKALPPPTPAVIVSPTPPEVAPAFGEEPLTAAEIRERAGVPEGQARILEREQFPKESKKVPFAPEVQNLFKELTKEIKEGPQRESFESALSDLFAIEDIPSGTPITFDIFKKAKRLQLEAEATIQPGTGKKEIEFILGSFTKEQLEDFFRKEFEKFKGSK